MTDLTPLVLGVIGGNGGVGASSFAAALALVALPAMLIDLDAVGGGADVLLGIEREPGARWSGLQVNGGRLDPVVLAAGLPRWREVAVLAADGGGPTPAAALQVVDAAVQVTSVVLDLPRSPSPMRDALLRRCTLCVVVATAEVRELAAARAVLDSLPDVPAGAVLRRGAVPIAVAAGLLGVPKLGVLPALDRGRFSRTSSRVAGGVLDGLRGVA